MFSSLLSLTPCKTRQFRREYCSKSSISDERLFCFSAKFSMVFSNWLIFSSFFLISFSRSSNFADINSSDSVTLIWDSLASSWKVKSSFTWFSILFKQFRSNFANSGEFKPFEKTSSGKELRPSLSFTYFESSPSFHLSERSLFLLPKKNLIMTNYVNNVKQNLK